MGVRAHSRPCQVRHRVIDWRNPTLVRLYTMSFLFAPAVYKDLRWSICLGTDLFSFCATLHDVASRLQCAGVEPSDGRLTRQPSLTAQRCTPSNESSTMYSKQWLKAVCMQPTLRNERICEPVSQNAHALRSSFQRLRICKGRRLTGLCSPLCRRHTAPFAP